MLYAFIKLYARVAIKIYCPHLYINKPEILKSVGPLLLACNHPNSFLDGMILTTLFEAKLYSLARGDAFKNARIRKILLWLKLLPVYRTSEGVENLEHNYTTFAACRKVFKKNAIILIFSEAGSVNEWHLRPLRKGTGRLALSSWQQGIPVKVLPVTINYSSFKDFGKNIHLYFGNFILKNQVVNEKSTGSQLLLFNSLLQQQLQQFVYELKSTDKKQIREKFHIHISPIKTALLALPALIGFIIHLPYYFITKFITFSFFKNSDHYDSVLIALLLLTYPFYLLLLAVIAFYFSNSLIAIPALLLTPFSAWACTKIKYQLYQLYYIYKN